MIYDVIIIGAGPAGMNAAVYAGRYKLKTLVFGALIGGKAGEANEICNFLTYGKIKGFDFVNKMKEQVEKLGIGLKPETVEGIKQEKDCFKIKTYNKEYSAKKLILAMGTEKMKLGVRNEAQLLGKGISYCATCDASFYKNKTAAVVGGGNAALTSALLIAGYAKQVYILYKSDNFSKAEPAWIESINKNRKIKPIFNSNITKLIGDDRLKEIEVNRKERLKVDGVFVEIGSAPNTKLVEQLKIKTENGFIKTDKFQRTNVKGVFAAGDITDNPLKQMITAAAEGAIAASTAYRELMEER